MPPDYNKRDAGVYYLQRDEHQKRRTEKYQKRYLGNLNDFSVFQSFLHDLDSDAPEWELLFNQMNKDSMDKCYAYDNMIMLYESYVKELTDMMYD